MFYLSPALKKNTVTVLQTAPEDIAQTLETQGLTEQALIHLAALSFDDIAVMRNFVFTVVSHVDREQIKQVVAFLVEDWLKRNRRDVTKLLASKSLTRSFLAYQLVHHKEDAAAHFESDGVIYSGLSGYQQAAIASGAVNMPVPMSEVAFFLFRKENLVYSVGENEAATLRSDREETTSTILATYLNAIDAFIINYFIAGIDETRKEQEDDEMQDEHSGRKVSVGLAVREAMIKGGDLAEIFMQALSDNNICYDEFFQGGTKKYLKEPLYSVLIATQPTLALSK